MKSTILYTCNNSKESESIASESIANENTVNESKENESNIFLSINEKLRASLVVDPCITSNPWL
eukprot:Pgem_evm1s355